MKLVEKSHMCQLVEKSHMCQVVEKSHMCQLVEKSHLCQIVEKSHLCLSHVAQYGCRKELESVALARIDSSRSHDRCDI